MAVLNDVHLDLNFDPTSCVTKATGVAGIDTFPDSFTDHTSRQQQPLDSKSSTAVYGKLGCDPPLALLEAFLDKLSTTEKNLDFILMPGDLVVHGVPLNPDDPTEGNYTLLEQTIG